jgi:putative membrane protein
VLFRSFLRTAVEGNLAEIKFGELAVQKASSADVKDFAQKMVTDHTAVNANLEVIADSMGVMVPKKLSKEDQAEHDKLNTLAGTAFDAEYLTIMVKDHHQDLREFRQEANATSDTALQADVMKAARVIREHTVMVDKLATDRGIPVPAHKPTPAATP